MNSEIKENITRLKLPEHYKDTVTQYLSPIAEEIATSIATANKSNSSHSPFILGVQGSQGSGKSTCSEFIQLLLNKKHHLKTVVLSIDDFYLTRAERQNLAT
ncbi:MAG: phosphoribulokinase, partial [Gammaproteobacteria bacterium]|nr:phosphoribulokinase [Gammaproteobacteria bacterium]